MKYLIFPLLMAASSLAHSQEIVVGPAFEKFGLLAGAWSLEVRCKVLDKEERTNFDRDFAVINVSLATSFDRSDIVVGIQQSAQKTADSERYAQCDDEVRSIVKTAYVIGRVWSMDIRKAVLESAKRLPSAKK